MLDGLGVAFLDAVVLAEVTLSIPAQGMLVLVGPGGAGKSTLLRTLAGLNDAQPGLRTWGRALFQGAPLDAERRPTLVLQKARLLASSLRENLASSIPERAQLTRVQQAALMARMLEAHALGHLVECLDEPVDRLELAVMRRLAIVRALFAQPAVLMVDEPTAGVEDAQQAATIMDLLCAQATQRAVVLVTHNRRDAQRAGGTTALLAGGRVQELVPTARFWSQPGSAPAQQFVATGSCRVPSPTARAEELAEDVAPPPPLPPAALAATAPPTQGDGPRGFFWLSKGRLGGMQRPGLVGDLGHELSALRALGVRVLVTLEEEVHLDRGVMAAAGMEHVHFPVPDMGAPGVEEALALLEVMRAHLQRGVALVLHCRAGMGRTGTMLAAFLVGEGATAAQAVEHARRINPRWIQSDEQVQFLVELQGRLDHGRHRPDRPTPQTKQPA